MLGFIKKTDGSKQSGGARGASLEPRVIAQMLEQMPVAVMMADLEDFRITYMNETSRKALKAIEHLLPCKAENLVGQCIDIFHKNPSHQRRLLSDPRNLPHKAQIKIGDETLDLLVSPLLDQRGTYIGPMLTWSVITDKVKVEQETMRQAQMLDQMPINAMLLDASDFKIVYANRTSITTLKKIEHLLPCRADQVVGQCVDVFHKNPSHQRRLLSDPRNLPHRAKIKLGPEILSLEVSAVNDKDGRYIAALLTWSVITAQVELTETMKGIVESVTAASTQLQATSQSMAATAEETSNQASTVAAASEQLGTSINEISKQVTRSASISQNAVTEAERSNDLVKGLSTAAEKIGDVVNLINDIASQTNLLALNATIEAARAGEAGKGFAVVAAEVKNLANQTAKATEDIASQVSAIQEATTSAVGAIKKIGETINEISEISTAISSAVEEQSAATKEVATNITGVTTASAETGKAASDVLQAATGLSKQAETMSGEVDKFLVSIGAK